MPNAFTAVSNVSKLNLLNLLHLFFYTLITSYLVLKLICNQAVGYSCLPNAKDEEGFVSLVINKTEEEMRQVGKKKIEEAIHKIMGSAQALSVKVDEMRYVPDNK